MFDLKKSVPSSSHSHSGARSSKIERNLLNCLFYLEDVSVSFANSKVVALKNINLSINKRDKLFLLGPSGAGKTTLLKLLAGMLSPTEGRIVGPFKNGIDCRKNFISMIFQELKLINDWSVKDNIWVSYDPNIYKNKNEFESELENLTKIFSIQDRMQLKIHQANGGLRQKVAIIRSLLTRPRILLADEPTSALDRESSLKLYQVLNYYNEKKEMSFVWASHNQEFVKKLSGKIINLNQGQLVYMGYSCFI